MDNIKKKRIMAGGLASVLVGTSGCASVRTCDKPHVETYFVDNELNIENTANSEQDFISYISEDFFNKFNNKEYIVDDRIEDVFNTFAILKYVNNNAVKSFLSEYVSSYEKTIGRQLSSGEIIDLILRNMDDNPGYLHITYSNDGYTYAITVNRSSSNYILESAMYNDEARIDMKKTIFINDCEINEDLSDYRIEDTFLFYDNRYTYNYLELDNLDDVCNISLYNKDESITSFITSENIKFISDDIIGSFKQNKTFNEYLTGNDEMLRLFFEDGYDETVRKILQNSKRLVFN